MSRKSTPDIMGAVLTATPETWDGKEIDYPLARIKVGQRMRPLAPAEVEAMAESLRQIGLLNAIHLLPDGTLVAGNHRRAAAELLGWTHIRARIVELNEIDAELAEIDENLRRSNLSILEEAEHLLRREELLEAKGARAKPGDNQHTAGDGGGATVAPPPATTAGMAKGAGLSERSAQMRLQIARNLDSEAKAAIRGTDLASSTTQLVELARQPAERQRTIAAMLATGRADNVPHAVALLDLEPGVIDLVSCTSLRDNTSALRALARLPADQQRPVVEMLATGRAATITDAVASLAAAAANAVERQVSAEPALMSGWDGMGWASISELEQEVREVYGIFYRDDHERRSAPSDMRAAARLGIGGFYASILKQIGVKAYRKGDLQRAINNVASQMEQAAGQPAEVFAPNEDARRAATVPAGRTLMEVMRTDEELADDDWRADIAEREAAADKAERQCLRLVVVAELNDVALLTAMRRYWSDRDLRSFASDADPEAACRRHIVKSPSGSVDDRFRIETGQGHVSIWLKEHGDYWHRKADGAYTYNRWALLTIGLLPQLLPAQVVAAETDPWAVAVNSPGSRQQRAELLAEAITPWVHEYRDEYGRTWQTLMRDGNPSHSNSVFWQDITAEFTSRGLAIDPDILKFAIKRVFSEPAALVASNADGKLLIDWTDDDWAAHAERSQTEPALEFVAGDPKPVGPGTIGGPDTYLPARLAPVSQRDDYDGDEWYTPAEYVNAARRVMGSIDLDPASCDMAQTVVQAGAYLTKEKNGLRSSHWQHHNIWLNPPYSDPARWIEKLLAEYDRGTYVQQAVVLVNNATETAWFQALLARNFSVCLLSRRVAFWRHDQAGVTARQGQAIFYLGRNVNAFVNEFESFGPIVRRVE